MPKAEDQGGRDSQVSGHIKLKSNTSRQLRQKEKKMKFSCSSADKFKASSWRSVHFLQGFSWKYCPTCSFSGFQQQYPVHADRNVHCKLLPDLKQQHSQLIKEDEICFIKAIFKKKYKTIWVRERNECSEVTARRCYLILVRMALRTPCKCVYLLVYVPSEMQLRCAPCNIFHAVMYLKRLRYWYNGFIVSLYNAYFVRQITRCIPHTPLSDSIKQH